VWQKLALEPDADDGSRQVNHPVHICKTTSASAECLTRRCTNRRYVFEFVSHWDYTTISFRRRALPAPMTRLDR
jgi:hypothetical protein